MRHLFAVAGRQVGYESARPSPSQTMQAGEALKSREPWRCEADLVGLSAIGKPTSALPVIRPADGTARAFHVWVVGLPWLAQY